MSNPSGFCKCGCGQRMKLADRTDSSKGWVKGEPYDYAKGHSQRTPVFEGEMPLCLCGCGKPTKLAKWTKKDLGHVKGQPMPYLQGHYPRELMQMTDPDNYTVENRGYETVCFITKCRKDKDGYGIVGGGERSIRGPERAHRRSWEQNVGPIPEGMEVHHLCEQTGCIRPDHLELKTRTEHQRAHSRWTPDDIRAIRSSTKTDKALAEEYGMTHRNVHFIRTFHTWKDIDP